MVLSSASRFLNPSTVCGISFVKSHSPSCLWASIHSGGRSPQYNAERPPSQTPAEAPTWTANVPSLDCQPNTILAVRWFSGPMGSTKQRQMFCLHDMEPFRISRTLHMKLHPRAFQLPRGICHYSHAYTLAPSIPVLQWSFRRAWAWLKPRCPGAQSVQVVVSEASIEDLLAVPL